MIQELRFTKTCYMLMLKYEMINKNPDIDILFTNYIKVSNSLKPKKVVPIKIIPLQLQLK